MYEHYLREREREVNGFSSSFRFRDFFFCCCWAYVYWIRQCMCDAAATDVRDNRKSIDRPHYHSNLKVLSPPQRSIIG